MQEWKSSLILVICLALGAKKLSRSASFGTRINYSNKNIFRGDMKEGNAPKKTKIIYARFKKIIEYYPAVKESLRIFDRMKRTGQFIQF